MDKTKKAWGVWPGEKSADVCRHTLSCWLSVLDMQWEEKEEKKSEPPVRWSLYAPQKSNLD